MRSLSRSYLSCPQPSEVVFNSLHTNILDGNCSFNIISIALVHPVCVFLAKNNYNTVRSPLLYRRTSGFSVETSAKTLVDDSKGPGAAPPTLLTGADGDYGRRRGPLFQHTFTIYQRKNVGDSMSRRQRKIRHPSMRGTRRSLRPGAEFLRTSCGSSQVDKNKTMSITANPRMGAVGGVVVALYRAR